MYIYMHTFIKLSHATKEKKKAVFSRDLKTYAIFIDSAKVM